MAIFSLCVFNWHFASFNLGTQRKSHHCNVMSAGDTNLGWTLEQAVFRWKNFQDIIS